MKSSSFARSLELAKLVTQVGLKELRSGDLKSRYDQAVLIAKSLSQLKGAAMKVGQLLSLDLDNYFPPEAIEILSQLQNAAVAHPYEEIERILRAELPQEKRDLLTQISRVPIGVASMGQVHKARYQGREVALKVQYSAVETSVESDLKILKTIAASFCQVTGRKMDLEPLFKEFRTMLEQELNYELEAGYQGQFKNKILKLNESGNYHFRVPSVVQELSTKKVLVTDFEEGVTFRSWLNSKPSQEDKDRVASAMLDLYFHEFFEWGLVQTDPNWGNFLIDAKRPDLSICLLDFGASRTYSSEFVQTYISLLECASEKRSSDLREIAINFGLMDRRESEAAFQVFEDLLSTAIKPFFIGNSGAAYFDFSDKEHALNSQNAGKALAGELVYSPPPYALIFLHRKLAGVYSILKSLEVRLDISPYWQMMRDLSKGAR
jgi:aarF domain-containing kinase